MEKEIFDTGGKSFNILVSPGPADGKRHPVILFVHGNFGLGPPYGDQIMGFAADLAKAGYVTAVPQLYADKSPHPDDMDPRPHIETLAAAIAKVASRADADPDRLGLVGFSLGAAASMGYIASRPAGSVRAFADFFGPFFQDIQPHVGKFPPTIIFHNKNDKIVLIGNSEELGRVLPSGLDHRLVPYVEVSPPLNHAFRPGGKADIDSREKTREWFAAHLPPGGSETARTKDAGVTPGTVPDSPP
jgi:dienelactone hydrolase